MMLHSTPCAKWCTKTSHVLLRSGLSVHDGTKEKMSCTSGHPLTAMEQTVEFGRCVNKNETHNDTPQQIRELIHKRKE